MRQHRNLWIAALCLATFLVGCNGTIVSHTEPDSDAGPTPKAKCPGGTDADGDGYGEGCPAGADCDDSDPLTHPGAKEVCDNKDNDCNGTTDEGQPNACGTCDPGCFSLGDAPFPVDTTADQDLDTVDGVGLDENGDLVLDKSKVNFNYMWIANCGDLKRGTISKVDTKNKVEAARYFTTTCNSKPGATSCVDVHGKPIAKDQVHSPSRTAVDFNFDVWVANRAHNGQASATKIANDPADCIDRNNNGKIETSRDQDGDGKITVDCNEDGNPDDSKTLCTLPGLKGKAPEFMGDDDECVLMTVNYDVPKAIGRSMCLSPAIDAKPSHAWVGTYSHSTNRFYKIDGSTGALSGPYDLVAGQHVYGCMVDSKGVLWATGGGSITYLNTYKPTQVGPKISPPWTGSAFYGITVDGNDHIWLGGTSTGRIYRYKPDRTSFAALAKGSWTGLKTPAAFGYTRGIAADSRGKVWVAAHSGQDNKMADGYIWRTDQSVADGLHDLSGSKDYWVVDGGAVTGVGVDFSGHVWGISYHGSLASRLEVDAKGDPALPPGTKINSYVSVGSHPYTYSDFTGYGLKNFTRPLGQYVYHLKPCLPGVKAVWKVLRWNATVPTNTKLSVRVRSGDGEASMGPWLGPLSSPTNLDKASITPLDPNPAQVLQIEFTFQTSEKEKSPVLHDLKLTYACDPNLG